MIELYLSSDGKHTVHAAAETPEELNKITPFAQALYKAVLGAYGTKAQMWQAVVTNGHGAEKLQSEAGDGKGNGEAKAVKRIDTVEQTAQAAAPKCPVHDKPMVFRQGRYGAFWSCPTRLPSGRWCSVTQDAAEPGRWKTDDER